MLTSIRPEIIWNIPSSPKELHVDYPHVNLQPPITECATGKSGATGCASSLQLALYPDLRPTVVGPSLSIPDP